MREETFVQSAFQLATSAIKWSGAASAMWWGFFSFNEWMALLGLLTAVVGSVSNSRVSKHYKKREDARAQERHDERHDKPQGVKTRTGRVRSLGVQVPGR